MIPRLAWVDVFTNKAFGGNPACVCLDANARSAEWMQSLAREMRASETAFIQQERQPYPLRWFAPLAEVDLCAHATIAAAHILWEVGEVSENSDIEFSTQSAVLRAQKVGDSIDLHLPVIRSQPVSRDSKLIQALGVEPKYIARAGRDYIVELDSEKTVRDLIPNLGLLRAMGTGGIIVTSRADMKDCDFVLRSFDPLIGIDEDPVTGSAHCSLAPFWAARLQKTEFVAFHASSRGGMVRARLASGRVIVSGHAVTVAIGELRA